MAKSSSKKEKKSSACECSNMDCGSGGFYLLGAIGTAIHYLSITVGFWPSVISLLKALVWPVFVVLKILGL